MKIMSFKCDICDKDFSARDEKGEVQPVGGMSGFIIKTQKQEDGSLKPTLMQYDCDFCSECNVKMVKHFTELKSLSKKE